MLDFEIWQVATSVFKAPYKAAGLKLPKYFKDLGLHVVNCTSKY